jgi:hypothetical protein
MVKKEPTIAKPGNIEVAEKAENLVEVIVIDTLNDFEKFSERHMDC